MIQVQNLTKYYSDVCAVNQINLDIPGGEILGLLGPNGAGKTTTLRMLTGYLKPTSGTVRVKDFSIEDQALEIKKILGYLPESAPLYHEMLVFDYLQYVAGIREVPAPRRLARIRRLSQLCGLKEVMHKPIGELSKGYRQRVGLAHAMMNDPEILVLDEPTSGLDPNQIAEIRDIIREIGREKTVILSTHILSEAEATCDRVVIINQGKIAADGNVETLKQSAGHTSLVHMVLADAPFDSVKDTLAAVEGVQEVVRVSEQDGSLRLRLATSIDRDLRPKIYATVKQTDWVLLEFRQETQTLETIFRELTREN